MAEPITIPISVFEVTVHYERPALLIWSEHRALIAQQFFEALTPWRPDVDDMEIRQAGKLSEQGLNFKLPGRLASFFFGPSSCYFRQDSVSWETASETLDILSAVLSVVEKSGIQLARKETMLSLHLQPRQVKFVDLLAPFVPPQLATLAEPPIRTMAAVVKWEDRKVTLDGSGVIANGIFVRLERSFDAAVSYDDVAQQLREDQRKLFAILGVEEDLE